MLWYYWSQVYVDSVVYLQVKPLLNAARAEDEMRQKLEELEKTLEELEKEQKLRKELEERGVQLLKEKNELSLQVCIN